MGVSQFMLGQPVTVLSDSMNERINSVAMDDSGVGGIPGQIPNPSSFSGMGDGETGTLSPGAAAAKARRLNPNGQGGNGGDAVVLNSQGSINNSVSNQTVQTFATNLFPNDPVMHQVAAAR